tara:strand:- start:1211 stop:1417 length:207 start_codon:yes stop_codon:yes gene_type:complete
MLDAFTIEECKKNEEVLNLKIKNLEFAITESEKLINESKINYEALIFLKRRIAKSKQELEVLYLIKKQ